MAKKKARTAAQKAATKKLVARNKKAKSNAAPPSPQWWIAAKEFFKGMLYGAVRAFTVAPVANMVKENAPKGLLEVTGAENIDEVAEGMTLGGVLMAGASGPARDAAKSGLNVAGARVGGNLALRGKGYTPKDDPDEEWA